MSKEFVSIKQIGDLFIDNYNQNIKQNSKKENIF